MSVSLYKIVIESHTFYRKWKKKKIMVLDKWWPLIICNPWIMTTGLGFWGPYQAGENSHTFDLLGLSLESCEDFKAHTGIKDSINLTYTVDGQCSQLFLRGVRLDGAKLPTQDWFASFGENCRHPLLCPYWVQKLVEVMTSDTALGTKSVLILSVSHKNSVCIMDLVRMWESRSLHGALGDNWCLLLAQAHKLKALAW